MRHLQSIIRLSIPRLPAIKVYKLQMVVILMVPVVNKVFRLLSRQLRLLLILLLVLLPPGLSRARDKTLDFGGRVMICMIQLEHADAEHLASALEPFLSPEGTITPDGPTNTLIINDRDDILILSTAINGKAEIFVTGDRDVLALQEIQSMRIVSPRKFWETLKAQPPEVT